MQVVRLVRWLHIHEFVVHGLWWTGFLPANRYHVRLQAIKSEDIIAQSGKPKAGAKKPTIEEQMAKVDPRCIRPEFILDRFAPRNAKRIIRVCNVNTNRMYRCVCVGFDCWMVADKGTTVSRLPSTSSDGPRCVALLAFMETAACCRKTRSSGVVRPLHQLGWEMLNLHARAGTEVRRG